MNTVLNLVKAAVVLEVSIFSFQANAQETIIAQKELPKTAQTFIAENFSSQKITHVIKEVDYRIKTEYEVYFSDNTKVEFDGKGNWKEVNGNNAAIPTEFISTNITRYIGQNFPTQKITKIEKSSSKFEVELLNGPDLEFSTNGNFLRIDD